MSQRTRKFYKLSDLSEEEVIRLMDSVETPANSDEEDAADYDSDDSVVDPDFDPHVHEISPEDDALLNEHIEQVRVSVILFNFFIGFHYCFIFYRIIDRSVMIRI